MLWFLSVFSISGGLVRTSRPSCCPGYWMGKAHETYREMLELGMRCPVLYLVSSRGDRTRVL